MSEAEAYANAVARREEEAVRDAFAIAALTGCGAEWAKTKDTDQIAIACFDMADAMMDARHPDPMRRDRNGVTPGMRNYLDKQKKGRTHDR